MGHPISRYMTALPLTIGRTLSLALARQQMNRLSIRHLPVLDGGKLVGVLSLRDIELIESLPGVSADNAAVEEAMSQDVLTVAPSDELPEVARRMADRKYGSAVVLEGDQVIGIFTTIDALRAIGELAAPPGKATKKVVRKKAAAARSGRRAPR